MADLRRNQAIVAAIFLLLSGSLCFVAILLDDSAYSYVVLGTMTDAVEIIYNLILMLTMLLALGMVWLRAIRTIASLHNLNDFSKLIAVSTLSLAMLTTLTFVVE